MIDKTVVIPKVVIYHNALEKVSGILELAKNGQNHEDSHGIMQGISPWGYYGTLIQVRNYNHDILESDSKEEINQKELLNSLYDSFDDVVMDYISEYKDSGGWPEYIDPEHIDGLGDYKNNQFWNSSWLSFLKYHPRDYVLDNLNRESGDKKRFAMEFHTDYDERFSEIPESKPFITVTAYLNDDYTGGEICFIDEVTGKLYSYKPKAGDITVFPSSAPYWHGVLPAYDSERHLIRTFLMYNYPGDKEVINKYGKQDTDFWTKFKKEKYQELEKTNDPKYMLTLVFLPGEEVNVDEKEYRKVISIKEGPIKVGEE